MPYSLSHQGSQEGATREDSERLKYLLKITQKAVKEYSNIDLPNSKACVSPFSFLHIVLLEAEIVFFLLFPPTFTHLWPQYMINHNVLLD